ncbi:hypothetical protein AB4K20DRAFT_1866485 [Rhizopus microsporus]|uniref:Uncharacterized protein n=1 Tax=Rhizopus microsporus TaxID=58291 RepID=A0A1X0SBZ2_RHIZD|nr:hypothetical protein BCV71DRAFT_232001 [Rhizopus microsporus]
MIDKFSEADYVINIWATLIRYTFCQTHLWSHCIVPANMKKNATVYLKLNFRLLDRLSSNDWATGEFGANLVKWKYFTYKKKLAIITKSQLNKLVKMYCVNEQYISRIKIPFVQIMGVQAVVYYMELHSPG